MGHGYHCILIRDQIFHRHIIIKANSSTAVIPVFGRNDIDFLSDYHKKLLLICQNCL